MKFTRILIIVGICCVAGLLCVYVMHLQAQDRGRGARVALNTNEQQSVTQRIEQFRNRQRGNWGEQGQPERNVNWGNQDRSEDRSSRNSEDYYNVIVNNNIFRPLGWRPSKTEPEYTFNGTWVAEDASKSVGYVTERRSNRFHTVGIGDKIGDAVVTDIKEKEISLDKNGEKITLRAGTMQFLKTGSSRRGGESRGNDNNRDNDEERNASSDRENNDRSEREASERRRREWTERAQEMRRRYESASRRDRERMRREFMERGGFRGHR